jgi:hypothetical protein
LILTQYAYCDSMVILVHPRAARAVLLDPQVFKYLHTDRPERQPFLLSNRLFLADKARLELPFAVEIIPIGETLERNAFRFTGAEAGDSETLVVSFAFAPEGITGRATLRNEKGQWRVIERQMREE